MKQHYSKSIMKKTNILITLFVLFAYQINAHALTKPVITSITTDSGISVSDYITNDTSIQIHGTATPNSQIALKINGFSTSLFGVYVITDSSGNFIFDLTPYDPLNDGTTTFIAESSLGGESMDSDPKSVTIDTIIPEVTSIAVVTPSETQPTSINFLVNFSEKVNNISADDFELTLTNSVGASINSITPSSGTGSNVIVNVVISNPTVDSGTIRLDLKANTNLIDPAGNGNGTSGYVSAFTSGSSYELNPTTLSNSSAELKKAITIYYNTSNSNLTITSKKIIDHIAIYDVCGKLIISTTEKSINLNYLKTGVYIVNIGSEGKLFSKKITK
ncbi:Ig-like domain-containing protein [Wenyingzhuangia sp. 2_MG-2023]|uniref:Ig-like domain-containing protein n=1 Tax=Wenyingzhuangia sp. 2_MG-2023 TaxID=3062639 RepID=UPI0026E11CB3|nr:Ig-like domain-containing protein [Wenyingzhuangia sp. 2_MG-2023]MDO6737295.1 Ig-like domain-containing protein [Wenyingzhuangia sp. 2_MG-2023]